MCKTINHNTNRMENHLRFHTLLFVAVSIFRTNITRKFFAYEFSYLIFEESLCEKHNYREIIKYEAEYLIENKITNPKEYYDKFFD